MNGLPSWDEFVPLTSSAAAKRLAGRMMPPESPMYKKSFQTALSCGDVWCPVRGPNLSSNSSQYKPLTLTGLALHTSQDLLTHLLIHLFNIYGMPTVF